MVVDEGTEDISELIDVYIPALNINKGLGTGITCALYL
jgi:hypothetical protein